jgi:hypothetical protein
MVTMEKRNNSPIYLIGAVLGVVLGFIGAHMYVQSVEENNAGERPRLESGDALKLGLLAITVLRQITDLGAKGGRR